MSRQHILLKFTSKKYVNDFMEGKLYMNSLHYFWNEYPIEQARRKKEEYMRTHPNKNPEEVIIPIKYTLSPGQADLFEGAAGTSYIEDIDKDFGGNTLTDAVLRSVGYQYCNVLCLYRLDYRYNPPFFQYDEPQMKEFGDYVVIIENETEFLRRICKVVNEKEYKFLCGNVHYHSIKKDGKRSEAYERHHMIAKVEGEVDMKEFAPKVKRDCFSKMDIFKTQNEWRVALYRGTKDTQAYTLNINPIKDIARCVRVEDFTKELDKLVIGGQIKLGEEGYYGNIGRSELKNLFYDLGDNKVEIFACIG